MKRYLKPQWLLPAAILMLLVAYGTINSRENIEGQGDMVYAGQPGSKVEAGELSRSQAAELIHNSTGFSKTSLGGLQLYTGAYQKGIENGLWAGLMTRPHERVHPLS